MMGRGLVDGVASASLLFENQLDTALAALRTGAGKLRRIGGRIEWAVFAGALALALMDAWTRWR